MRQRVGRAIGPDVSTQRLAEFDMRLVAKLVEKGRAVDRARREVDKESDMSGRTMGNLILMTLICITVFVVFMALRPARAGETPIYGPDGKYQGSVFEYGKTQTYADRNGYFTGSAVNNGNGTTSFFNRSGNFTGSAGSSIDRAFNFNRR
jgi:hypothetical protein